MQFFLLSSCTKVIFRQTGTELYVELCSKECSLYAAIFGALVGKGCIAACPDCHRACSMGGSRDPDSATPKPNREQLTKRQEVSVTEFHLNQASLGSFPKWGTPR